MGSFGQGFAGESGIISYTQAQLQSKDLENQAKASKYQAEYTEKAAKVEEQDFREIVAQTVGMATTATGASGLDAGEGSSLDAVEAIIRRGELDAAAIKFRGSVNAWSARENSRQLETAAKNNMAIARPSATNQAFFQGPDQTKWMSSGYSQNQQQNYNQAIMNYNDWNYGSGVGPSGSYGVENGEYNPGSEQFAGAFY